MGTGASCNKPNLADDPHDNQSWAGRPHDHLYRHINSTNGKAPFSTGMVLANPRVGPRLSSPLDSPQPTLRAKITPASSPYATLSRQDRSDQASLKDNLTTLSWDGSLKPPRSPRDYTDKNSMTSGSLRFHRTRTLSGSKHCQQQQSKKELSDCPRIYTGESLRQKASEERLTRWRSNPDTQRSLSRSSTLSRRIMRRSPNATNKSHSEFEYPPNEVRQSPKFHFRKNTLRSRSSDPVRNHLDRSGANSALETPLSGSGYTSPMSMGSQVDSIPSTSSRGRSSGSGSVPSGSTNSNYVVKRNASVLKRPPSLLMSSKAKFKEGQPASSSPLSFSIIHSPSSIKDIPKQEHSANQISQGDKLKHAHSRELPPSAPSKPSRKSWNSSEDHKLSSDTNEDQLGIQMFQSETPNASVVKSQAPKLKRSLRRPRLSREPTVKGLPVSQSVQYSSLFETTPSFLLPYPITDKNAVLARILSRFISQSVPFCRPVMAALCSAGLLSTRSADSALLKEEGPIRNRYVLEKLHISRHGLVNFNLALVNFVHLRSLPVSDGFLRSVTDIISCVIEFLDILEANVCVEPEAPHRAINKSDSLGELQKELQKTVDRIFGPKTPPSNEEKITKQTSDVFCLEIVYQTEEAFDNCGTSADRLDVGYKMYSSEYSDIYRPVLTVDLSGLQFKDPFWHHFGDIIRKYNNITRMSLCGCALQPKNLDSLLGNAASTTLSLRLLNLRLNPLGDTGISLLRAPRLPCLRYLSLACCNLTPAALWTTLPLLRRLHALDIGYNDLSRMPEPLLVRLCSFFQLRMLRLRNASLSPGCLELLCESLKRVRQLQLLDMSGHKLTRLNINSLSAGIASCGTLQKISLEQCNIVDEDCSIFSKALLMNRSLEDLEMSGNRIEDKGAGLLSSVVREKSSLRCVSLNRCGLSKHGLTCLLKASLSSNSKVTSMHLAGNESFSRQEYDEHFREILQKLNSIGKKIIL